MTEGVRWAPYEIRIVFFKPALGEQKRLYWTADGKLLTIVPAEAVIPCMMEEDLMRGLGREALKKFLLETNPNLGEGDIYLDCPQPGHAKSGKQPNEEMAHITSQGVTIGPPVREG